MTTPRGIDPAALDDADFERRLLDSASDDAPAAGDAERAWARFALQLDALGERLQPREAPRSWWNSPAARALGWTVAGALAGGSAVAVWLRPEPSPPPANGSPMAPPPSSAPASGAPASSARPIAPPALAEPLAPPPQRELSRPPRAVRLRPRSTRHDPPSAERAPERESLLAREVAALDAARRLLALGDTRGARHRIEQYRRDFPSGELFADAEVVAIEALAEEADTPALQSAARAFLARYPLDPHAPRIRELLRRSGANVQ